MALVSMRELLDHAAENTYGIPAFNVNNLEQVQAVMEAANETGAPVILQASAGARKYAGEPFIKHLIPAIAHLARSGKPTLAAITELLNCRCSMGGKLFLLKGRWGRWSSRSLTPPSWCRRDAGSNWAEMVTS